MFESIKTEMEFISYIRHKLGEPKVRVEISDNQIRTNLFDAIQLFREYATNRGNERTYMVIDLIKGQNTYELPENVLQIGYEKTTFSVSQWVLAQLSGYAASDLLSLKSFDMVSFYMLQQWIHYLRYITPSKYRTRFNHNTKILTVTPTPQTNDRLFVEVFIADNYENLLNERFIREYTLALCKITLGEIRSKFGSLPGFNNSVSLNGDTLRNEGKEEKEKLEDDLVNNFKWSSPPYPIFRSTD